MSTSFTSHSQAGQDEFAFESSGRKLTGRFLDIGCNDAIYHSNTYALEQLGWTGLRVDVANFAAGRSSPFLLADATKPNPYIEAFCREPVDYLSLDIDTYAVNAMQWLSAFFFGIVTVEHDLYRVGEGVRNHLRAIMAERYNLVKPDVVAEGYGPFEDWYIHKEYKPA